jgi:formylglycine-generating enzyme required for sulfatase activity/dienelactone hydrolase
MRRFAYVSLSVFLLCCGLLAVEESDPTKVAPVVQGGDRASGQAVAWPLHDGKESIAEYAKRAGLPVEIALDLEDGVKVEMALIPAGTFRMGSPDGEPGRKEDGREGPQHDVTIARPFYLGKYEVTVAQYRRFVGSTSYITDAEKGGHKGWGRNPNWGELSDVNWTKPNFAQTDHHPVCLLSWNDATAFVAWASKTTARVVRLPTEAEWEYACRAGTSTRFFAGSKDAELSAAGWFNGNAALTSHPVGRKLPNAWGLHDVHGNVWEWCEDRAQVDYYTASPRVDPPGPKAGENRVLRGGSWDNEPAFCRSASRLWHPPDRRGTSYGFRILVEPAAGGSTPVAVKTAPEVSDAKAQQAFSSVLQELDPLLAKCAFADAIALLDRKARDPAFADAVELLRQEKADVEAVAALRRSACEALRKRVGQQVTLAKGSTTFKGKVLNEPKPDLVTLDLGGAQLSFGYDHLSAQDVDRHAPPAGAAEVDLRLRGLMYCYAGDIAKAKEYLSDPRIPHPESGLRRIAAMPAGEERAPAQKAAEDPKASSPVEDLSGTWECTTGSWWSVLTVRRSGKSYLASRLMWKGFTEEEARKISAGGKVGEPTWPSAACAIGEVAIRVNGDKVDLVYGASRPLVKGKVKDWGSTYTKTARLMSPGIIVQLPLEEPDPTGGLNMIRMWKQGILDKPLPLDKELGVVHKMSCIDCDDYHYTCYIPKNYNHAKPTPVLMHLHSGGEAKPLSTKLAEETGWLMVGLTESRNGPWEPILENTTAVLFDLRRRFNVDTTRLCYAGFSGGARAVSYFACHRPDLCAGLIMCCAGYESSYAPAMRIPIYYLSGKGDLNFDEVQKDFLAAKAAGRVCRFAGDTGGHTWDDAHKEDAVRWLAANAAAPAPEAAKEKK